MVLLQSLWDLQEAALRKLACDIRWTALRDAVLHQHYWYL